MTDPQYLEILFEEAISDGDLEFVSQATATEPGVVRLLGAKAGEIDPNALMSIPLHSARGGKIGFLAPLSLIVAPFNHTYLIEERD